MGKGHQRRDVSSVIGNTPVVRLDRMFSDSSIEVWAKIEAANPGGSVKDRPALAMIRRAEQKGWLTPGGTVVEPTSGNTGIGLAVVCAAKGYDLALTMPENMSAERKKLLEFLGARVILTQQQLGMSGAVEAAEKLAARDGYYMPDQFANPANAAVHRRTTAKEILRDVPQAIHCLICGVGTGGTITGVGSLLVEKFPNMQIVAVEPAESAVISGGQPGAHGIQGIGAGFVPQVLDLDLIDQVVAVTEDEAMQAAGQLARQEGIAAGISSGAAIAAVSSFLENTSPALDTPPLRIVVILPDGADRYLSVLDL